MGKPRQQLEKLAYAAARKEMAEAEYVKNIQQIPVDKMRPIIERMKAAQKEYQDVLFNLDARYWRT